MKLGKYILLSLLSFLTVSAAYGDASHFHFKELSRLIQKNHLTTIEQVIPKLPEEMRRNFILMYHSNSRHRGASFQSPRMILFNESADMIIAVAGDANQINGNALEVIENVGPKSHFTFHQLVFSNDSSLPVEGDNKSCRTCHRDNSAPNWDAYPSWPGAYGSQALMNKAEDEGFMSFIEKVKAKDPGMARFQGLSMDENTSLELQGSINHTFATLLGDLNKQRIIAAFNDALKKNPQFKKLRIPMALLSAGCTEDASSIVPEEFRFQLAETYKDYLEGLKKATLEHALNDSKVSYQLAEGEAPSSYISWDKGPETAFFSEVKPFAGIGYLMKYVMSLDPDTFSITQEAYVDHPNTPVQSASIYNSGDSLISIESDLLGDGVSLLSCDELKSRLPN